MKSHTLSKASQELGISRTAIYGLIKNHEQLIKCHLHVTDKGKKTLTEKGIELLRPFTKGKRECKTKKNISVSDSKLQNGNLTETLKEQIEYLKKKLEEEEKKNKIEVISKNEIINKLIENQEKERERSAQDRKRTDTIIMKMTNDLEQVRSENRLFLEESKKKEEVKKPELKKTDRVISIQEFINAKIEEDIERSNFEVEKRRLKQKYEDPLQGRSALYKIYVKMFKPEKLRQTS